VRRDDLAALSPYRTRHIKRFGDYILTPSTPEPFDGDLVLLIGPSLDGTEEEAIA
jgi:hypothetical protein